jgi:hypothetical protein
LRSLGSLSWFYWLDWLYWPRWNVQCPSLSRPREMVFKFHGVKISQDKFYWFNFELFLLIPLFWLPTSDSWPQIYPLSLFPLSLLLFYARPASSSRITTLLPSNFLWIGDVLHLLSSFYYFSRRVHRVHRV